MTIIVERIASSIMVNAFLHFDICLIIRYHNFVQLLKVKGTFIEFWYPWKWIHCCSFLLCILFFWLLIYLSKL